MKPVKSTLELMREEALRRGWKPIILDGRPVEPAKPRAKRRKHAKPSGNAAKE